MKRVLVTYGSKRGGTAEIAEWVGRVLREAGLEADVRPARSVREVTGYAGVVLGGSVYMGRWHKDARRFARRFGHVLRDRPVWLFSSGPLDHSAEQQDVPVVASAEKAAERLWAQEHVTFGGVLRPGAKGFPASAMSRKLAGDYRDRTQIRTWAVSIADVLKSDA